MKLSTLMMAATILVGSTSAMAQAITGAGSTFGAPIYGKWSEKSKSSTGVELNYQAMAWLFSDRQRQPLYGAAYRVR